MKVTVILKDFTDTFFDGFGEAIVGFNTLDNRAKFDKCKQLACEKRVTMKVGSGQFREAVDLNALLRKNCKFDFKLEPRRGYRLATFDIVEAR